MRLTLARDLILPIDAVTETFGIIAMRRVGKTYLACDFAEELVKSKQPFVALDPTGAWWGLRASADGKGPGLPVVILGGHHGDMPLEPASGALVAELVVQNPGYYICDFSLFGSGNEEARFAVDFAEKLYRLKASSKDPLHLFVDEADKFIPQQPMPDERRMLGAFDTLVRRGGIRGIGTTLITQRGAVINKNVWSQVGTMFVLRIMGEGDQEAVERWAKGHGTKDQVREILATVGSLENGHGWVWSPVFLKRRSLHLFRERETYNSSATPKVGERRVEPKILAGVELDLVRERMASTIEKIKAEDPKELKKRVRQLEEELLKRQHPLRPVHMPKRVEVPMLKDAHIKGLERFAASLDKSIETLVGIVADVQAAGGDLRAVAAPLEAAIQRLKSGSSQAPREEVVGRVAYDHTPKDAPGLSGEPRDRILMSLVWWQTAGVKQATRHQVAFVARYRVGGHFMNTLGQMRAEGLIEYPTPGLIELTSKGQGLAPNRPDTRPSLGALIAATREVLRTDPAKKIFDVVVEGMRHHDAMTRDEVAEKAGYSIGGHFMNVLGELRGLGVITYPKPGTIALSKLFADLA